MHLQCLLTSLTEYSNLLMTNWCFALEQVDQLAQAGMMSINVFKLKLYQLGGHQMMCLFLPSAVNQGKNLPAANVTHCHPTLSSDICCRGCKWQPVIKYPTQACCQQFSHMPATVCGEGKSITHPINGTGMYNAVPVQEFSTILRVCSSSI